MFRSLFARGTGRPVAPPRLTRTRGKLVLERLEAREVPAVNIWQGDVNNDAYLNANWSLNRRPDTSDEVWFDGLTSSVNCIGLQRADDVAWDVMNDPVPPRLGEGSYDKIRFINGYSGHVTLGDNLMVYDLELTTGNLDQGYNGVGSAISVVESFDWTGGKLNSTEDLSSITFEPGSTATITPGVGNTLETGSSFLLADGSGSNLLGATKTFNSGIIGLKNGAGVDVGGECMAFFAPVGANVQMVKVDKKDGLYTIQTGGSIIVEGFFDGERALVNNAGKLHIRTTFENNTVSEAFARFEGTISNAQGAPTIESTNGEIVVTRHAALKADKNIEFINGMFNTGGVGAGHATAGVSLIETPKLIVNGTLISFADNNRKLGNTLIFETIHVDGEVEWNSGTLNPYICAIANDHRCDKWTSSGKFAINSFICDPCKITSIAIVADGTEVAATTLQAKLWPVISSDVEVVVDVDELPDSGTEGLNSHFNPLVTNKILYVQRPQT